MGSSTVAPPHQEPKATRLASLNPFTRPLHKDLTFQVVVGMVLGVLAGVYLEPLAEQLQFLSDIFIHLIQMVVGLVIFCTITHGIATVRDFSKVGRIAIKALVYFEVVTTIALVIGLVTINVLHPGSGLNIDPSTLSDPTGADAPAQSVGFGEFVTNLVPTSAVGAFADGDILPILVFSVLFACGLSSIGDRAEPVLNAIGSLQEALFWIIRQVMKLAPLAAFGAIAFSVAEFGLGTMVSLGTLILEFYLTVVLFFVLVLWPISRYAGFSLLKLMRYIRQELLLVIGTSSSESVLPQLTAKLKNLGVKDSVVGLVLPTAYSFNHDGTCLYFASVSVFLAQATGADLGWKSQLSLMFVLLLTSKGGAGVAGSAIPILALTLSATNSIPVGAVALVLGIHKVMSSAFVFTNIAGNCVATLVVGKWEKAVDTVRLHRQLDGRVDEEAGLAVSPVATGSTV